jgi:protein-disulfide isomerase
MKKENLVLLAAAVLLAGFVLATYAYQGFQARKVEQLASGSSSTFVRPHSKTWGPAEARVDLVEFLDPACESCAAFFPFTKQLIAAHPGKLRLVVRYAPLHDGSDEVVKMLEAAGRQGKYWEALQLMFDTQSAWASHHRPDPQALWQFLPRIGVDVQRLREDMNDPAVIAVLQQDIADAKALGVRMTPGFFVNGKPLTEFGARQLQALVEAEVRAAYP